MGFDRLIRFEDAAGLISYGNLDKETPLDAIEGTEVAVVTGSFDEGFSTTADVKKVVKLLPPLESVPLLICMGLNYKQHIKEAGGTIPLDPVMFTKPADALAGPREDISIHPDAQTMLDYEGELCVVIGRDVKDVKASEALSCVFGYTVGNDVSARFFNAAERCGGQFCYAKSFDGFAPIGSCIASPSCIPDPQGLELTTKVNGAVRQQSATSQMIWTVQEVIQHLSRGTTLRKGTVIMMGTPPGVGWFMKPPKFLEDNDVVDIHISGIGNITNRMVFAH